MTERTAHAIAALIGIAVLAFVSACIAHEAVGHGGMCLLSGGRITLLTSVYARCSISSPLIDAAGPSTGILTGSILWAVLRMRTITSTTTRLFLVFAMAINLFWGIGYLAFSGVTNGGDWAFLVRALDPSLQSAGRIAMAVAGAFAYLVSMRIVAKQLPARVPLPVAYVSMGVVSCVAVLFYFGPTVPALREAVNEGFLAPVGLLLIARRRAQGEDRDAGEGVSTIVRGNAWTVAAAVACIVFFATMGHGFGTA